MTTNQERAAQLLYNEGCGSGDTAQYIARRLADAGLLTPDALPPLDFYDDCGVWPINAHPDQYVEMHVTGTGRRLVEMYAPAQMEPLTALRLAAALIEAVTLTNKEKK